MTEYKYRLRKALAVTLAASLTMSCLTGCSISGKNTDFAGETGAAVAAETAGGENLAAGSDELVEKVASELVRTHGSEQGKEETVYIVADANGNPTSKIVSAWLKNPDEKDQLKDSSDLTDIENVKGDESYETDGDGVLVWKADGNDIYYQGKTDKELPITTSISYKLDGKEISPEDLAGASGHLTMTFDYENHTGQERMAGGKKVTLYQPFTVVSGVMFDNEKVKDVKVDHGKVINSGAQTIVAGLAMPGLSESLGLDELAKKQDKELFTEIADQVTIEADVTDFSLLTTVTMYDNTALQELKLDQADRVDDLWDSMDELKDASEQLVDGTDQLADGADRLSSGAGELEAGINSLDQGAGDLSAGIKRAATGSFALSDGLSTASSGSVILLMNLKKLAVGASDLHAGSKELKNSLPALVTGSTDLKQGIKAYTDGAAALNSNMPDICAGIGSIQEGTISLKEGAKAYVDGVNTFIDESSQGIRQLADGGAQLAGLENLGDVSTALDQINGALGSTDSEGTILYGSNQVSAGLKTLSTQLGLLKDSTDAENFTKLAQGLGQMKQGIGSASQIIAGASGLLQKDSATLNSRISQVNDQITEVNKEAKAVNHAVEDLTDARTSLSQQTEEANSQIGQANDQIQSAISALETAMSQVEDEDARAELKGQIQTLKGISISKVSVDSPSVPEEIPENDPIEALSLDTSAYAVYAGKLDAIEEALNQGMSQIPSDMDHASIEAIADAVDQLSAGASATDAGLSQLASGVTTLKKSTDSFPAAAKGMKQLNAGLAKMADKKGSFMQGGKTLKKSGTQIMTGIDKLKKGESALSTGAGKFSKGLGTLVSNNKSLNKGSAAINKGAEEVLSGSKKLEKGAKSLKNGSSQLYQGGKELKKGVAALESGAKELKAGMETLSSGSDSLTAGTGKLAKGGSSLTAGLASLVDGADQLKSGMTQFDEEGINKLTSLFEDDLEGILDRVKALQKYSKEYDSFAGSDKNTDSSVKFVLRTDSIEKKED